MALLLFVGLQICKDDLTQVPGSGFTRAAVIVPDAQVSQRSQTLLHAQHVVIDAPCRMFLSKEINLCPVSVIVDKKSRATIHNYQLQLSSGELNHGACYLKLVPQFGVSSCSNHIQ